MSKIKNLTYQHFSDHFLSQDIGRKITNLADILDLPLNNIKGLSIEDANDLANNNLKTIRDVSQLSLEQSNLIKTQLRFEPAKFNKILVACKLVYLATQKKPSFGKKATTKIIFIGLDNAGKTSIINLLSGKKLSDSVNLGPTTMVNHVNISAQDIDLIVWDFGGQEAYRQAYFQNPVEFFTELDLVIFVIDALDSQRYNETLKYFSQFLETLTYLDENPYILVLLHKVDPDLQADPEFQINLEYLNGQIRDILRQVKFGRDVVTSSIYNSYYAQPLIVGQLKDAFKTQQLGGGNVLILDAMMKMTELIVQIGNKQVQMQEQVQNQVKDLIERIIGMSNGVKTFIENSPTPSPTINSIQNPQQRVVTQVGTPPSGGTLTPPQGWPEGIPFPPPHGWSSGETIAHLSSTSPPNEAEGRINPKKEPSSNVKQDPLRGEIINELQDIFKRRGIVRE